MTTPLPLKHYRAEDMLKSGRPITVRALSSGDRPLLEEGMHHLSPESRYFRFFTPKDELTTEELDYFVNINFIDHVALVACVGSTPESDGRERPVGIGRYVLCSKNGEPKSAELAFAVDEEYQGLGVATRLFAHLIKVARQQEFVRFRATVLADNVKMLKVFSHCGLPMESEATGAGSYEITLSLLAGDHS